MRWPAAASSWASAVDLNALTWGRSFGPGNAPAMVVTLCSKAWRSTTSAGVATSPNLTGPDATRRHGHRPAGAGGGIRTHTGQVLGLVPLPLGYAGSTAELTGATVRDRRRAPLPSGAVSVILPTAQNSSAVSPTHEIFNRLLRERIIFLGTEVDDDIANVVCAQLLHLAGDDSDRDIWLYINSPGGSVTAGMAIYDTMQFVEPDVATVCMGLGASMGQFLLCAGAKGKRYALPHARIMMPQPSGGFRGQAADIAIQAEQLLYVKQLMAERIAYHTGQKVDQVQEDFERDRWFTAEQAKDYGIIDNVIVKRGEML